jgi:arylsulfatase A
MVRNVASLLAIFLGSLVSLAARAADRPNIILIMADDLGYEAIGADGGESYQTPVLDGLAETGMRFDRCYVQPLCTPTRVQLMTGMSNVRNYIRFGLLDREAVTFAHLLKQAGYATGIAGKWQLGHEPDSPQHFGFDESCLWQHTRRPSRYANPGLEYNGEPRDFPNGEYGPDLVNEFAREFVERHKGGPFFLYYPMILTHAPYDPTPDSPEYDPKATEGKGNDPKHFGDMVEYTDKLVGKLVAKLDELEIRDNTLVIFLGDNGTGRGVTSQFKGAAYPGGKGGANARGMHVPLIANWPGHVPAGAVNDELVESTDFLPTVCEAAGAAVPSDLTIDGLSFYQQLLGSAGSPREAIYCWYARDGGQKASSEFAMNKSLKVYRGGRVFDLENDPHEEHAMTMADLSGAQAQEARKLQDVIKKYADARPPGMVVQPMGGRGEEAGKAGKKAKAAGKGGKRKAARAKRRALKQQSSAQAEKTE